MVLIVNGIEVRAELRPDGVWFFRQAKRSYPAEEDDEQEMFVRWYLGGGVWGHSVPNHLVASKEQGKKEKLKGLSKGATDLIIATRGVIPLAPYPLVIEMKTTGATWSAVKPEQEAWLKYWASQGAFAAVCTGRECAIAACGMVGIGDGSGARADFRIDPRLST